MLIGVISDIHGNKQALERVLADMPDVETLVSLGDVIGYGPHPRQCVELVQAHADESLYGNHEHYLAHPDQCRGNQDAYAGIQHAQQELTGEQRNWAENRPWRHWVTDEFYTAHGYPDEDTPFKYVRKSNATELIPYFREQDFSILAVGHSHIQFKQDLKKFHDDAGIVFNPGSVGQPRDNDPTAAYAVVDTDEMSVSLHRVEYDVETTVNAIEAAGLPSASGKRLLTGSYPQSARSSRRRRRR